MAPEGTEDWAVETQRASVSAQASKSKKKTPGQKQLSGSGRAPLFQGLVTKISPPRMPHLKVGIFACRTPHRPNPIGLSLGRIVSVDRKAGKLILAGLDIIDGTPVLDVKPYLPQFEAL